MQLAHQSVNNELLAQLELTSTKVYPLPGATLRRVTNDADPRLTHLQGTPQGDKVTFYEHVATIRDKKTGTFFVAFRETMDALLARQSDTQKFPEWLMKHPAKKTELRVFIHQVTKHPSDPTVETHQDWLAEIGDESAFSTLAYFLLKAEIISEQMYRSME